MKPIDELNDSTHQVIKERLPFCTTVQASKYGSFYYKAWKSADENRKKEIEEKYLQDIVYSAIYVKPPLGEKLRRILQAFVNQKRIKIVDSLLYRLLEPVVWRGLNALNGHIRSNAIALFLLAFPMRDVDANSKDNCESIRKQTEILETFLTDLIPSVRSSCIIGVCKICDLYWELMPLNVLKKIFGIMVEKLAFDSVSADVRASVIKGFIIILDNPLSHNVLEKVLPQISMCLHDNNEKVRITFVNLLHKIKSMKTIKYWNVVSMEHVLARLTIETSLSVQKLITKLIQNSFCPENLHSEEQLKRGIVLIEKNFEAARKFYHFVAESMSSVEFAVDYILLMLRCVYSCVKQNISEQNGSNSSPETTISDKQNVSMESNGRLTLGNRTVICGLFECGAILWRSIGQKLQLPENVKHHKRLVKISSKIIQECFSHFEDPRINDVLLYYASLLPASSAPYLAASAVKKLKNLEDTNGTNSKVFGSLLEAACFWRFKELSDVIVIWLDLCGDLDRTCSSIVNGTPVRKRSRTVKFAPKSPSQDTPRAKPRLGLAYLEYLLTNTQCRQYLLRSQCDHLSRLCKKLDNFFAACWENLKLEETGIHNVDLKEILLADRLQFSIQMLLTKNSAKESSVDETVEFFARKMVYHEFNTFDLLNEEKGSAKLNAEKLLLQFFVSCQHLLMLNLSSDAFVETLCGFLLKISNEYDRQSLPVFCGIAPVIYNVIDFIYNCNCATIKVEILVQPLIDVWCQKFITLLDEKNEFFIETDNFWKPAVVAMKETLSATMNEIKDPEIQKTSKNHLEKIIGGVKNIQDETI